MNKLYKTFPELQIGVSSSTVEPQLSRSQLSGFLATE